MELTIAIVLLILGLGLVAGFTAGFVGVGGGIIMVPILLELFRGWGLPDESVVQAAMGTSLAVILPGLVLQLVLAGLMTVSAIRMLTEKIIHEREDYRFLWWQGLLVGCGVGLVAGMSGLAGGVVLVPALALILGVPTGWLAGTSSAVILFSALAAAVGYLTATPPSALGWGFHGFTCLPVVGLLAITAIPGAQLGAWANRRTGSVLFRRIFAALMLVVVIRLVTSR